MNMTLKTHLRGFVMTTSAIALLIAFPGNWYRPECHPGRGCGVRPNIPDLGALARWHPRVHESISYHRHSPIRPTLPIHSFRSIIFTRF